MTDFNGFSKQLPQFFKKLQQNNTREWFMAHKNEYETIVKLPCQEFVSAMGAELIKFCPQINAIPKVNKSLFRINRDIRFSHDKSPYKTNLGILFWDGPGKRMESSGFYFHVENDHLMLGCGMHIFPKTALLAYREAVVDKNSSASLKKAVHAVAKKGYTVGTKHYKRSPRGFKPGNDFQAHHLLYNGLTARIELPVPDILFSPGIINFVVGHFKDMRVIHQWLVENI